MRRAMRLSLPLWVVLGYGALALVGALLAVVFGPTTNAGSCGWARDAWLDLTATEGALASVVLGVAGAALAVIVSRFLFRRARWARALHDALRPLVSGRDDALLVLMAIASAFGEELFFRGFLSATIGIWLSSVAFGVLHQVRGAGRYGWAISAFAMGVFFAVLFALTGQLIGCIVSHALVNIVNLRYLRDHDLHPKPRKLGGLLGQS
jgi:membrane protease YdiL (CAAX protease family)